jgi:hypothetical protein
MPFIKWLEVSSRNHRNKAEDSVHYIRVHSSQSCFIKDIHQIVGNQNNFLLIFIFLHTEIFDDEKKQKSTSQAPNEINARKQISYNVKKNLHKNINLHEQFH